jgi:MFS family permease
MEFILREIHKTGSFGWLYLANLFLGFHFFVVSYVHSSFLSTFMSQAQMAYLYAAASALSLLALSITSSLLSRVGNYLTGVTAALFDLGALIGLAYFTDPGLLVVCFALHYFLVPVILFTLDVYVESNTTSEDSTGNTRGLFLLVATVSSLFGPVLAGALAGASADYGRVYLASAWFLVPFILILLIKFRQFADPVYQPFSFLKTLAGVLRDGDVFHIAMAQFLMRLYFAWMVHWLLVARYRRRALHYAVALRVRGVASRHHRGPVAR